MAIAWYVEEARRSLEDQQRRAEALRTRGGQIAGFGAAVLALTAGNAAEVLGAVEGPARAAVGLTLFTAMVCLAIAVSAAVWGVIKPKPFAALASEEITIYLSGRFLAEPDLWRVHLRSLQALEKAIQRAQEDGNTAAVAIMISLYAFLVGLGFSLVSLGTLIFELI